MKKAISLLVILLSCVACLEAENRHAFYLEPDGSAVWAVMSEDLREDQGFLIGARRGDTEIADALRQVGATWVETTVVRDQEPYTVLTEGRFESAAWMLEQFLTEIGFEAETKLTFKGERVTLSFRFWETEESEVDFEAEDGNVECLLEPVKQYRFVLTEGEFVESTGFLLDAGDTVAVMLDLDEVKDSSPDESEPESVFYSLTWTTRRVRVSAPRRRRWARRPPAPAERHERSAAPRRRPPSDG